MQEEWKDIKDFEGYYQISNLGRIKSLNRFIKNPSGTKSLRKSQFLKTCLNTRNGYVYVSLTKENKEKTKRIHRLVAEAFIPNPENKPEVNHIDGNKKNNCVNNLEWVTTSENQKHACKNNLINHYKRKIIQLDKELNFIREWESIGEAANKLKISEENIIACCRGRLKRVGGYVWKYL